MISVHIIRLFHFLLVFGLAISIFVNNCYYKKLAIILLIFLLVKYVIGYEQCGLTMLEYMYLGEKNYKSGFIYRLVNPIVKVPENYFNNGLLIIHIMWIAILVWQLDDYGCTPGFFD